MTMRPLQNQATDIAVFVLSVALLGFVTKMVRDVTADAMAGTKAPALLPATKRGELLVRYIGGPQRFGFPIGLEGEIRNFAGHQWVILDTPHNRQVIRESKRWVIVRDQPAHLRRKSPGFLPATTYTHIAEQIFARAKELFGTTTNPDEAGYILPDGTMLDFSGRHYEPSAPISGPFRERMADHREITFAWPEDDSPGGFEAMKQVMNWGAVRLSIYHETVVVNLVKPPTEPQIKAIKRALWYNPDAVLVVEVDNAELDQIDYQEFTHPFSNWKAFIERTIALGRPTGLGQRTGLVPQTSTLLPQIHKPYREQTHQIIEDLQKAVDETRKADSIRRIERILDRIDTEILDREIITGLDDLQDAVEDYKGIERAGLTPEEYQEEKEAAFEAITEAVDGLDIDEDALESLEEEEIEKPPPVKLPAPNELRRKGIATLDRLIQDKQRDTRPSPSLSDARKAVYKDILNGFGTVQEAKDYVEGMPEDSVLFTARGDEISFTLIKLIITDIERNPWLSPFRREPPERSWQPPLIPKTAMYYTISFQGDTNFKPGEIVTEQALKAENDRVMKLGLRPARGWVTSKGELLSRGNGSKPSAELEGLAPSIEKGRIDVFRLGREGYTVIGTPTQVEAINSLISRCGLTPQDLAGLTVRFEYHPGLFREGEKPVASYQSSTKTIWLGPDPTEYDFYHELSHFLDGISGRGISRHKEADRFARKWGVPRKKICPESFPQVTVQGRESILLKELEKSELMSATIPRDDLKRIADKYGWWAAKLAESVCPHNDVACVERESRRLAKARRARLE